MINNFHKKVGIVYDTNNTKPLFIVDIVDITDEVSYKSLKEQANNNYKELIATKEMQDENFKNDIVSKVNILANALKNYVSK